MTFYRTTNCPGCQAVEDTLNDLVMACRYVNLDSRNGLPPELAGRRLPLLVDGDKIIEGSRPILAHLEKLADFKKQWYKYQSDVCYCDDEDE